MAGRAPSSTTSRSAWRCCDARRRCWWRCRGSMSRSASPIRPPTPVCSTRLVSRSRCAMSALERSEEALAEAESFLTRLADEADADPRLLEQAEERLFALRAVARKHAVIVAELAALQIGR